MKRTPDYGCVAPLTAEEVARYFGTERPSVASVEGADPFWEELERGQARCVIVYEGGERKLFFAGYSFD